MYVCVVVFCMQPPIRRPLSYLICCCCYLPLSLFPLTVPLPAVLLFCIFAKLVKTKKEILDRKNVYKKPVLFCYLCDCVCVLVCVYVGELSMCVCVCVCRLGSFTLYDPVLLFCFFFVFFCAADFGYVNLRAQTTTTTIRTTRGASLVC